MHQYLMFCLTLIFVCEVFLVHSLSYTRVLIAAVNKQKTELKLEFFNNCFENPQKPYLNTGAWVIAEM